jgi:hypothetical protein
MDVSPPTSPLFRPLPTLRIGIVGHTSCDADPALLQRTAEVLGALCELARSCGSSTPNEVGSGPASSSAVRLVTGLAPGFDRLAWECWRALAAATSGESQVPQRRTSLVILPEPLATYRDRLESAGADVEALHALEEELTRTPEPSGGGCSLLELGGTVGASGRTEGDPHAARLVVQNCDVLVAYWNGLARRDAGGGGARSLTYRAVKLAERIGIPVLWLRASGAASADGGGDESEAELEATDGAQRLRIEVADPKHSVAELEEHVRFLLRPATLESSRREEEEAREQERPLRHLAAAPGRVLRFLRGRSSAEHPSPERKHGLGLSAHQVEQLQGFFAEPHPSRVAWQVRFLGSFWDRFWKSIARATTPKASESTEPLTASQGSVGEPPKPPRSRTYALYERCDALASKYMSAYRGAFGAIYLLGALAVLLAALAFLAVTVGAKSWALWLGAIELVVIGAILILRASSIRLRLRERATQYRHIAELLRLSSWTYLVGRPLGKIALPAHRGPEHARTSWVSWLHDAWIREEHLPGAAGSEHRVRLPSPDLRGLVEHLRRGWIEDQIRYHERTGRRYRGLSSGIEDVVSTLFLVLLFVVSISVGFGFLAREYPETVCTSIASWLKFVALPVATVFPALAGALHGIKTQLEADRLESNSESMVELLKELDARFRSHGAPASGVSLEKIEQLVQRTCTIMLHELDDWHASHLTHELPI